MRSRVVNLVGAAVLVGSVATAFFFPSRTTCVAGPKVQVIAGGHTYRGQSACPALEQGAHPVLVAPLVQDESLYAFTVTTDHRVDVRVAIITVGVALSLGLFAVGTRLVPADRRRLWVGAVIRGGASLAAGGFIAASVLWAAFFHRCVPGPRPPEVVPPNLSRVLATCGFSPVAALSAMVIAVAIAALLVELVVYLVPAGRSRPVRRRRWHARAPRPLRPARFY